MQERLQMININDEDVNLGLTIGSTNYTNYKIRTMFINSLGAGANADSRTDLAFAASDPLSELVWSPHNGLSLKRARSNTADKKPFLLWNVGPSNKGPSTPSQIIRPKGNRDDNADADDDLFVDKAMLLMHLESCEGMERNMKIEEEGGSKDAVQKDQNCVDKQEEDLCPSQNFPSAEISKQNADMQSLKEPENEEVNENKMNVPISAPAPLSKKLAENDLCNPTKKDEPPRENSPPIDGSQTNSRICLYKEKGKEKALSDWGIYGRSLNDDNDGHESVESCDSVGLFSRGIKRQSYDEGVILGSKRTKKEIHDHPGSTPLTKPDSSFLNWISNMVKGFSDFNKEDSLSCALPLAFSNDVNGKNHHGNCMCDKAQDSASLNMGFHTVSQSLYCGDTNLLNTVQKENDSIKESQEVMVDDKNSPVNLPCKQIIICEREIDCGSNLAENKGSDLAVETNKAEEKTSPEMTSDVPGRSSLLTSLWVTRLCTKNARSEKCLEKIQETIECSTFCPKVDLDCQLNAVFPTDQKSSETRGDSVDSQVCRINSEASVDLKSKCKLCPITPSQKFRRPGAMTSLFARRLDALRHIMPSDNDVKDNQKPILYDIVSTHNTVALSEVFHAIRNLRLSRADILRWMNSNVSLSHLNGFFLRLRLGKLEAGQEGTSYYVACITGDAREGCSSKKSILVDVGGIKSSVTSQYVSNHDFLDDEIKAWWCRIKDSGCKVPSLDELTSKFNDRKSLGF